MTGKHKGWEAGAWLTVAPWGVNQSLFSVLSSERPQTLMLSLGGSLPSEGIGQSQQWAPILRGIRRPCQLVRGPRRLWYHTDQGSKPRWTSPWPCHLRQATPTTWWGFCGEQMKLQETHRTAWGGWVSALATDMWGGCPGAQPGPGCPIWPHHWARPSVFPVWARLDSLAVPMPSRDLVSASFLLPAGKRGEPWHRRSSPTPGLSFPIFKKGVMGSQQALPEDWVPRPQVIHVSRTCLPHGRCGEDSSAQELRRPPPPPTFPPLPATLPHSGHPIPFSQQLKTQLRRQHHFIHPKPEPPSYLGSGREPVSETQAIRLCQPPQGTGTPPF